MQTATQHDLTTVRPAGHHRLVEQAVPEDS